MDDIDISTAAKGMVTVLGTFGISPFALAISILMLFVCVRVNSMHLVLTQIWRFIPGRGNQDDAELNKYFDDQGKLMRFRFLTGLKARTLADAKRVIFWCRKHNVEMGAIKACGGYFDHSVPGIDMKALPGRWLASAMVVITGLLIVGSALLMVGFSSNRALMTMRSSGAWFWLSDESAEPLKVGKLIGIRAEQCEGAHQDLAVQSGFRIEEIDALCHFFKMDGRQKMVRDSVRELRIIIGCVGVPVIFWTWAAFGDVWRIGKTRNLIARLKARAHAANTKGPSVQVDNAESIDGARRARRFTVLISIRAVKR